MDNYRYIRADRQAEGLVVRFTESNLCGDTMAECIRMEMAQLVQYDRPGRIIVDFTDVHSISSSVIGSLLAVRSKLTEMSIPLALCCMPVPIREIYRTLQLEGTKFQVFDSVNDALRAPIVLERQGIREQMED